MKCFSNRIENITTQNSSYYDYDLGIVYVGRDILFDFLEDNSNVILKGPNTKSNKKLKLYIKKVKEIVEC